MTPIESLHDNRLATLLNVTMTVIESLALQTNCNPEQILSDYLFLSNKAVLETGSEPIVNKLTSHYSMLNEALN